MGWIADRAKWTFGKLTPSRGSSDDSQAQPSGSASPPDTSAPEPEAGPDSPAKTESSSDTDSGKEPESESGEPRSKNDTQEHDTLSDDGPPSNDDDTKQQPEADTDSGDDDSADDSSDDGTSDGEDASDITAPSIGPNTVIEHEPPEERLDFDKISDTDAMGNDKRREVVGQRYSASPARQATLYGIFVAVVIAVVIGGKALADRLDEPPKTVEDQAPWTGSENRTQQDLDFPKYGKPAS